MENILPKAKIVKRNKIVLPCIPTGIPNFLPDILSNRLSKPLVDEYGYKNYDLKWCTTRYTLINSLKKQKIWCIDGDILIRESSPNTRGYFLYGTDIPIIFICTSTGYQGEYPTPEMACIGVKSHKCETSTYIQGYERKEVPFDYSGKELMDNEIIEWLEQEKNIDSMRKVRQWAIDYDKQCKRLNQQAKENREKWEGIYREEREYESQRMIENHNILVKKISNKEKKHGW